MVALPEIGSAYISLLPSLKNFGKSTQAQLGPQMTSTGKKSGSTFGKVFGSSAMTPMKGLVAGIGGLFAAQKVAGFFKDSIAEAREAQVTTARTQSVIKSMGLGSIVTANQIGKLAMSISNKTAVDDEAIQSGQNLLLTFGNVAKSAGQANGVFSQTSQLMVDMSAAMGTDVKSSAIQLGKALNDPTRGVSALTRVGVSFSESQKTQIANFVKTGQVAKAQGLILGEVKNQFGGAAASMATPAERAKVAWANFQEQIGGLLLPIIDKLLTGLSGKVIPAVSTFVTQIQTGSGAGGRLATAFGTVSSVLSTVVGFVNQNRTAFATFLGVLAGFQIIRSITVGVMAFNAALAANPIGLVVIAIAALAAGLVMAYQKSETFRAVVDGVFSFLKTAVAFTVGFVKDHWQLIVSIIGGPLVAIGILVVKHWSAIKSFVMGAVNAVINFVRDHWRLIITIIGGPLGLAVALVTKHWTTIKSATTAAWNAIKSVISTQINAAKAVVSTAIGAMQTAFGKIAGIVDKVRGWFGDLVTAIGNKLSNAVDKVKAFPGDVLAALGDLSTKLYSKGKELIQGLIDGIKDAAGSIPNPLSLIPGVNKIPGLASGGRVLAGQPYLVGERGPELFTSSRSGYIVPNHALSGVRGGMSSADTGAKLDKLSRQLEVLTKVSATQGNEFGRALNNVVAHGARRR